MTNKISYIFSIVAFLLKIFIIDFEYETMKVFVGGIYYPSLSKMGNDFYLTSITTIMYFIASFILIVPLKKRNVIRIGSIFLLLIASSMEVSLFYLYTKMHMYAFVVLYEGILVFICSVMLLVGYVILFKRNNINILKLSVIVSFVLYLLFGVWTIYSQMATNLSNILSLLLMFLSYFPIKQAYYD